MEYTAFFYSTMNARSSAEEAHSSAMKAIIIIFSSPQEVIHPLPIKVSFAQFYGSLLIQQ